MPDLTVDDDVRDITAALLSFVDREVVPLEEAHRDLLVDERQRYLPDGRFAPEVLGLRRQVRMRSAEAEFYTLLGASELGGAGLGPQGAVHIQESLNRHVGPGRTLVTDVVLPSPFTNGLSPILRFLDPGTLEGYLPGIASGATTLCFGLSEPDAGSDVFSMKTRAARSDGGWVLNGSKQWITNAPYADYAMVFAVTDPEAVARRDGSGITGFFVDTRTPGFEVTSVIPVMGHLGGEVGIISLSDVHVPEDHVIGEVDRGMQVAMLGVGTGRMSLASSCVGLARWALERSVEYARERVTFGKPIAEHQAIQFHLADMAMDIYAAKSMVRHCAWSVETSDRLPVRQVSSVKAFSTEMLYRVMDHAVQVHGAMGLTNELRLEEGLRFARVMRIPDGTGEIQRRSIARRLLAGDLDI
jgi:acyl-CoA dehydrogenase